MQNIETEILADRRAKLTVTVDAERLQIELKSAASRIARKANIPGFRRGKAPYHIILRYFGEDAVFEEALEALGQAVYAEALKDSGLEPYAPGSLDEISRDPLVLTFTVPLVPDVDLGGYRDIRLPFSTPTVTAADVDQALDRAREQQATHEHVDRPVAMEDVALLDFVGTFVPNKTVKSKKSTRSDQIVLSSDNEERFIDRKGVKVLIAPTATYPVPGFPAEIVGMVVGDIREFSIAFSSDDMEIDEEARDRTIHFAVTCREVFKRDLPELTDEFARSLGDYVDLEDVRQKTRHEIEHEAEHNARDKYVDEILDHLLENVVTVSYPPVIIDERVDEMVQDFDRQLRQQGLNVEDYLSLNKLTIEDVRADFRQTATRQVERSLVLGQLSEAEQISVDSGEIDDETQTRMLSFGAQAAMAQQLMTSPEMRRTIATRLLTDKTLERLSQIARGEAPQLTALVEGPATHQDSAKKPATRKPRARKKKLAPQESNGVPTE